MTKNFERIVELAQQTQTLIVNYDNNADVMSVSFRTSKYYVGISADYKIATLIVNLETGEFNFDMIEKDLSVFNAMVLELMLIIPNMVEKIKD